ncbi:MAG: chorismate synthase [Candidatus Schekmanbacteria bacterium]|nr:chorismate synthase [Candidatus Schekmanbacteria bacterium]
MRWQTAGESHGPGLTALVDGIPAGLEIDFGVLAMEMARRQRGHGRGGRMKIETDAVRITAGVRYGRTTGGPVALWIENRDYENWQPVTHPEPLGAAERPSRQRLRPRPGHADLVGLVKFGHDDVRDVLERASARETAARVGVGALAKQLLAQFDVAIMSHVVALGGVTANAPTDVDHFAAEWLQALEMSPVRCLDAGAAIAMIAAIDAAKESGDTLGGVFEVRARGLPIGLGSYTQWNRKLDGRLAQALMSIPAIKGVEIGEGFASAHAPGSAVHDALFVDGSGSNAVLTRLRRRSNRAGGLEGGVTNGEELVARAAMKPIATLRRPVASVDLATGEAVRATAERSDVCAVPAAAVVGEAMTAITLADALLDKLGGDSMQESLAAWRRYRESLSRAFGAAEP